MIRTDGRPTIAMRESEPLPGQMTVEECIELAKREQAQDAWPTPESEPLYGGHN